MTVSSFWRVLAASFRDQKPQIQWISDELLDIDGTRFFATTSNYERKSTPDEFVILKNRAMIERELAMMDGKQVRNVLDLGIWQGGSVAFLDRALRPEKLVAIEYNKEPDDSPLRDYIRKYDRADNVKLHYWVNQGDANHMNEILSDEFREQSIDLVIDDASHFYEETRTSFNAIFPYLSAGAKFIIEDWGWAHDGSWTIGYFKDKPAQTNLIVELLALSKSRPDLVEKIEVFNPMVVITKGIGQVMRGAFDLGEFATSRGRRIEPWL